MVCFEAAELYFFFPSEEKHAKTFKEAEDLRMELKKKNVAVKVSGDLNTLFVSEKNDLFCFICF